MSLWGLFPIVEKIWFQLIQTLEDFVWMGESYCLSWAPIIGQCQKWGAEAGQPLPWLITGLAHWLLISNFKLKIVILSVISVWLEHIVTTDTEGKEIQAQ